MDESGKLTTPMWRSENLSKTRSRALPSPLRHRQGDGANKKAAHAARERLGLGLGWRTERHRKPK
jgi:hypothetical protein